MYFLILISLLFSSFPPKTCTAPDIVRESPRLDAQFLTSDLEDVFNQPGISGLVLKMATCCESEGHRGSSHDESSLPGVQHTMAFGITTLGTVYSSGIAALPCPPHCGGAKAKKAPRTTYDSFVEMKMREKLLKLIDGGMYIKVD